MDTHSKLMGLLQRAPYIGCCDVDRQYAVNWLMNNGVIVQKWIPVTERLPEIPDGFAEHPDPVLYMMASTRTIYAGYYGENGTYRDRYFRQYHDRYEGVDAEDVLYWMWQHDLPEPRMIKKYETSV